MCSFCLESRRSAYTLLSLSLTHPSRLLCPSLKPPFPAIIVVSSAQQSSRLVDDSILPSLPAPFSLFLLSSMILEQHSSFLSLALPSYLSLARSSHCCCCCDGRQRAKFSSPVVIPRVTRRSTLQSDMHVQLVHRSCMYLSLTGSCSCSHVLCVPHKSGENVHETLITAHKPKRTHVCFPSSLILILVIVFSFLLLIIITVTIISQKPDKSARESERKRKDERETAKARAYTQSTLSLRRICV